MTAHNGVRDGLVAASPLILNVAVLAASPLLAKIALKQAKATFPVRARRRASDSQACNEKTDALAQSDDQKPVGTNSAEIQQFGVWAMDLALGLSLLAAPVAGSIGALDPVRWGLVSAYFVAVVAGGGAFLYVLAVDDVARYVHLVGRYTVATLIGIAFYSLIALVTFLVTAF